MLFRSQGEGLRALLLGALLTSPVLHAAPTHLAPSRRSTRGCCYWEAAWTPPYSSGLTTNTDTSTSTSAQQRSRAVMLATTSALRRHSQPPPAAAHPISSLSLPPIADPGKSGGIVCSTGNTSTLTHTSTHAQTTEPRRRQSRCRSWQGRNGVVIGQGP